MLAFNNVVIKFGHVSKVSSLQERNSRASAAIYAVLAPVLQSGFWIATLLLIDFALLLQNIYTTKISLRRNNVWRIVSAKNGKPHQGCIFRLTYSYPELTKDHVLTSAYVEIFRTVTRKCLKGKRLFLTSHKQTCNEPENQSTVLQEPEHGSLRIRAHLSWRTGKHLPVLHVLRTYSRCLYPGY